MVLRFGFFYIGTQLLADLNARLKSEEELARVDSLTRIPNRRYFYELADTEIRRSLRYQRPFTVAYIDLDNFKLVNDRYGHHVGDAILLDVANLIDTNLRKFDMVARLGGDEFAILLPETGMDSARQVILRLQNVLLNEMHSHDWPVTFSIGVVTFTQQPRSVDEMLQEVDRLMYAAKNTGKNSVKHDLFEPVDQENTR
jgi:diguanylate cyclase (GGDEF)-like protein